MTRYERLEIIRRNLSKLIDGLLADGVMPDMVDLLIKGENYISAVARKVGVTNKIDEFNGEVK